MPRRLLPLFLAAALAVPVLALTTDASAAAASYIVVLKDGTDSGAVANEHARSHAAEVSHVYGYALKGYAARIPAARLDKVKADSRVAYVEADGIATISAKPSRGGGEPSPAPPQTLPWGIDKVDADVAFYPALTDSATSAEVSNVSVYVIDTGVGSHGDLNLFAHINFAGGKNTDCNGHGTHVAGTIAARDNTQDVVGVLPGAPITGVKVLGCNGSGTWSGVIAGIDWVKANAIRPAVANMSLGGGASDAVDTAVREAAASGVVFVVAAGNENTNACTKSPARAGAVNDVAANNGIITVAATDSADDEASWSNYGPCVDIWAPGVSILSTKNGGGTTTMSGTSMASPHTAGGAGLYLSTLTTTAPSSVEGALKSVATTTANKSKDLRTITRLYVGGF